MPVQPPPSMPGPPNTPDSIANYLNKLSLWIYQELQQGIRRDEATAHLLLYGGGPAVKALPPTGATPIYSLYVDSSGRVTAVSVPFGGGKP